MLPIVTKTLAIAAGEIGVHEVPENRGKRVEAYQRSVGIPPGSPWCAAFVAWSIEEAAKGLGVLNPWVRTGYCPSINSWATERGLIRSMPAAGDVFLLFGRANNQWRAHHCGFVCAVPSSHMVQTVEGNTSESGSPEGIGVFQRQRTVGANISFVRWSDLCETPEPWRLYLNHDLLGSAPIQDGRALFGVRAWGKALGFAVGWNQEDQAVTFDGQEQSFQVSLVGDTAYALVRDMATAAGLALRVATDNRAIYVSKP